MGKNGEFGKLWEMLVFREKFWNLEGNFVFWVIERHHKLS